MKKLLNILFILGISTQILFAQNKIQITPENALQSYLNNGDKTFDWKIDESITSEGVTLYRVIFTSQKWRDLIWKHELTLIVPEKIAYNDALLFVTGGSVKNGEPNTHDWDKNEIVSFSEIAKANQAIVAIVWQIPNQPLFDGRTEDEIISLTLHNYQNDHDFTWPLLFPMVKSAIRAMDVVQEFAKQEVNTRVNEFVVSGASKRGWTSWLTGASDKRVKAIGPMVIDMLNMPINIEYHKVAWGDYSIQIEDYVNLGIAQQVNSTQGSDLVKMIDPYSYRKVLTMPKMLFIGTNDEYWPVDAVKNYIDSIPGENYICYTPNAGHGLDGGKVALNTLSAFFGNSNRNAGYPTCTYSISEEKNKIVLTVNANANLLEDAILWSATSNDRDIRDNKWTEQSLNGKNKTTVNVEIKFPETGYKAFYVDLKYKAPYGGNYTQSTRMFLANPEKVLLNRSE